MKSMGHKAYDAFRAEMGDWLPEWNRLTELERREWERVANATMDAYEPK